MSGILSQQSAQYEQAEPLYQRALAFSSVNWEDHPTRQPASTTWHNFTEIRGSTIKQKHSISAPLHIKERAMGVDHPDLAKSLNKLAGIYRAQGKYEQAVALLKRALAIRERSMGPYHPKTVKVRKSYNLLKRS